VRSTIVEGGIKRGEELESDVEVGRGDSTGRNLSYKKTLIKRREGGENGGGVKPSGAQLLRAL